MRWLKVLAVIYPLMMIFTFGAASKHFHAEAIEACHVKQMQKEDCYSFDMDYRPEALLFSLLWPYFWSERLWERYV